MTRYPVRLILQAAAAVLVGCPAGPPGPAAQGTARREYRPGFDVLDYDLTIELPDSGRVIRGTAVLTVRRTPTDPRRSGGDTLVLDLVRLDVSSVNVDGRSVAFTRTPETVRVPLAAASSDTMRVEVTYGGEVRDGLVIRTDSLGRWTAFGDNWPNRARHWIPSIDHPSDKATVSWTVRTPPGRTVVANGRLLPPGRIQVQYREPRVTNRWREDRPVPTYAMVIAAAPLVRHELGVAACGLAEVERCVEQAVYVTPEVRDYMPGPFAAARGIVEWMARLVGPFPYEKLAHVQSSTIYGGMENASAIFYDERLFRDRAMSVDLIAHETAHQWFGDAVTSRDWAHLWLSEGFATYFSALWIERSVGDSAFRARMAATRAQILADPVAVPRRPVIDTLETNLTALLNVNSYQKGGWTLHMLRRLVGDSAFFRGVRGYYGAHRHGTAVTDDFRRAVEATAGRPLDWFFDQWLRRPGYATPTLTWDYDSTAARVSVTIDQARSPFGAYRFPLNLAVHEPSGGVRRVMIEVPAQPRTTVPLPFAVTARPTRVMPDPDVDLLARFDGP
ncbi:MAG: M1 family metallopeptidase [Gemmatimonadaceae bacterium]